MKPEFLVERQGKSFVLYAGLLDEAHQRGLDAIRTAIYQLPTKENGQTAVVTAEVTMRVDGVQRVFTGVGDAAPENVSKMMVPHLLRMAETRAKARALRDAINVGVTALEELGDHIVTDEDAEETVPASDKQVGFIFTLGGSRGYSHEGVDQLSTERFGYAVSELTKAEASRMIKWLQGESGTEAAASAAQPQAAAGRPALMPAPSPQATRAAAAPAPPASAPTIPATEAQIKAIYAISRNPENGTSVEEVEERCQKSFGHGISKLTKSQASKVIEGLKKGG